jgi:aminoglycoside phosphotransferase (APT) family kinase protein
LILGTPPAEVVIDLSLIRGLLQDQHPDLADLPCVPVDAGWDNMMVRLGQDLCLRLPRRAAAAGLIEHEQKWLPVLAANLPLAVPVPARTGMPGRGYPWKWSIVPWLAGLAADLCPPKQAHEARRLGTFLNALHTPAPADAPWNPFRSVPLHQRAPGIEARMERLGRSSPLITTELQRVWKEAVAAPIDVASSWIHGDLHPRNILVDAGALTGVIDWGDMAVGDRATDLAVIWMLFSDPRARREALAAYGAVSQATYLRAKGWAVGFGVTLLETGMANDPRHAAIGERTLRQVVADLRSLG